MNKCELYDMLAYLDLEQYEKVVAEIEKKDKEIERLNSIIKEVREYINKYLQEHVIDEYPDEQSTFYDEEERFIPNAKTKLLEILDKVIK